MQSLVSGWIPPCKPVPGGFGSATWSLPQTATLGTFGEMDRYAVSLLIPTQRPVPPGSINGKSQERKRCKVDGGGGGVLANGVEPELWGRSPSLVIWLMQALSKHSLSHLTLLTS